ncbi:MAG: glycerophosphodiester phosphodiesterase family protein [Gammaproteobacteria bacterium]|nr:glycerophosphodiester phosphodiesterase family protein [Gammaproteobacteria bacterium]
MRFLLTAMLLVAVNIHAEIAVQGHRGARAVRPENTLSAFKYALEIGVDVLELDLVVSKDDVLVIHHDLWVNQDLCLRDGKTIKQKEPLIELTLQQIKQFDCGSRKNPRFPQQVLQQGEQIPTLKELFSLVKDSRLEVSERVRFNIETKIYRPRSELTPTPQRFAELLVEEIQASPFRDRIIVQSFDYRTLKWVKRLDPGIKVSQLSSRSFVDLVAAARSIKADYISPDWKSLTADMVGEFHANDIKVAPWTANTPEAWNYLIDLGVDDIITDDPLALINYLRQKQLRPKHNGDFHLLMSIPLKQSQ